MQDSLITLCDFVGFANSGSAVWFVSHELYISYKSLNGPLVEAGGSALRYIWVTFPTQVLPSTPIDRLNPKTRQTFLSALPRDPLCYCCIKKQVAMEWSNQEFGVIKYQSNGQKAWLSGCWSPGFPDSELTFHKPQGVRGNTLPQAPGLPGEEELGRQGVRTE